MTSDDIHKHTRISYILILCNLLMLVHNTTKCHDDYSGRCGRVMDCGSRSCLPASNKHGGVSPVSWLQDMVPEAWTTTDSRWRLCVSGEEKMDLSHGDLLIQRLKACTGPNPTGKWQRPVNNPLLKAKINWQPFHFADCIFKYNCFEYFQIKFHLLLLHGV